MKYIKTFEKLDKSNWKELIPSYKIDIYEIINYIHNLKLPSKDPIEDRLGDLIWDTFPNVKDWEPKNLYPAIIGGILKRHRVIEFGNWGISDLYHGRINFIQTKSKGDNGVLIFVKLETEDEDMTNWIQIKGPVKIYGERTKFEEEVELLMNAKKYNL